MHRAIKRKCNNAYYPDRYGNYRTAKITQIKHHWWWKANRVFDKLNVTRNHTGKKKHLPYFMSVVIYTKKTLE